MIHLDRLTKTFDQKTAVDDITATIQPGKVTGFLGPNGAGKSTTMRMIMGLDRPTKGAATINGKRYAELRSPLTEVGALLDAKAVHTDRTAYNHLLALAATHGIPKRRVEEVVGLTGLESVAGKRVGGFSLGMGQRLGIAAAMLGDPATLILDEPVNGLDPEGVLWVRQFARHLAGQGRTVFLSSHLMSEMAQTADHIIVLGRGRILADAPVGDILAGATRNAVRVRTPQVDQLAHAIAAPDVTITGVEAQLIEVTGLSSAQIGDLAAATGVVLHELTPISASLEEAYLELTQDEVEYHSEISR
ncbi:multidrug ABC transporter ATP-binding protein [Leifsonia xyli subsp. xyli]|uniref:ABC transporter, ATP-binding protein n=2 Tax=Leifsonia xyli subsp. xyli TaxID=59736 RepID=Q6AFS5_LEIXX|nr:ATP-binding cassette domain-containing protein [Leifsonia xyli]AAT88770.1 ABC transporter, ATP-binding protein [Leifsonia xyli subsp. xyli str. CTCB07]ODA89483.1 multidrug ABC transporter ATP-binding protein [Leifsonia xyli subsp. xyli]